MYSDGSGGQVICLRTTDYHNEYLLLTCQQGASYRRSLISKAADSFFYSHTKTGSNRTVLAVVMKAHCPALFSAYTEQQLGMNPSASFGAPALLVEDPELMKPKPSKK
ncbi:hypothetical protein HDU80_004905 [Chytriomyces hyalinus]|nr:hypothetical protein HDU80_004905 [Chytriomyces hyalinus]